MKKYIEWRRKQGSLLLLITNLLEQKNSLDEQIEFDGLTKCARKFSKNYYFFAFVHIMRQPNALFIHAENIYLKIRSFDNKQYVKIKNIVLYGIFFVVVAKETYNKYKCKAPNCY